MSAEAVERLEEFLEPWFFFSLIWSVGASCNNDGRLKYNDWLRSRLEKETNLKLPLPKQGLVYDYFLDDAGIFASNNEESENKEEDETMTKKEKIVKLVKQKSF